MVVLTGNSINWFQAKVCKTAIDLYLQHGILASRNATPKNLRAVATSFTGKSYPRSHYGLMKASHDLERVLAQHPETVAHYGER